MPLSTTAWNDHGAGGIFEGHRDGRPPKQISISLTGCYCRRFTSMGSASIRSRTTPPITRIRKITIGSVQHHGFDAIERRPEKIMGYLQPFFGRITEQRLEVAQAFQPVHLGRTPEQHLKVAQAFQPVHLGPITKQHLEMAEAFQPVHYVHPVHPGQPGKAAPHFHIDPKSSILEACSPLPIGKMDAGSTINRKPLNLLGLR